MEPSGRKIMIVEDEGLIAADLRGRLEKAGYDVAPIADSASEALRIIGETGPDLVLMDIHIHGDVDGIQTAAQVRTQFDVPVVYLTAFEDTGTLQRASETQAFGYIKKPIASASLKGSIEMAIAKHGQERHLREQREWFSASFEAVPDGVVVTDALGRVCYLNPVARDLTGWKTEDALRQASREVLQLFYSASGLEVEDFIPAVILQAQPVALPSGVVLQDRQNRRYSIEGTMSPRWSDGRIDGIVIVFKNVSRQYFKGEQIHRDEKQSALIRMAGRISGSLDQELGAIAKESALLLGGLAVGSPLRNRAETIERAALDAIAVTNQLQTFAQQPKIHLSTIRLRVVLDRLEKAWKQLLPTFTLRLDDNLPAIEADEWQLTRSLINILLHASSRMQRDADITLDAAKPEAEEMREWVRLRITYTSNAESEASLEHVFEPLWSVESNGVALAYSMIREMGGLMTAAAEEGTVRFEMHLPQSNAAAEAMVAVKQEPAILLIEANPEVRRVLHEHFDKHGYNLLEATSCDEGLLVAHLYNGFLPLAIAHPEKDDWARFDLSDTLAGIKPGIRVRLLATGYWEENGEAGSQGWEGASRYLTKWDLLEWANRSMMPARAPVAALA